LNNYYDFFRFRLLEKILVLTQKKRSTIGISRTEVITNGVNPSQTVVEITLHSPDESNLIVKIILAAQVEWPEKSETSYAADDTIGIKTDLTTTVERRGK